jgi:heat shock protein HslJ
MDPNRYFDLLGAGMCAMLVTLAACAATPTQKPDKDAAQASAVDTYWRAVQIDGQAVGSSAEAREPHFVLSTDGGSVSGSTGCNRLSGKFTQSADGLRFGPLITTRMACQPAANELEARFLRALEATASSRVVGNTLELRDASGAVRMRLQPQK